MLRKTCQRESLSFPEKLVVHLHAMKPYEIVGVEKHSFLTSAQDGGEWCWMSIRAIPDVLQKCYLIPAGVQPLDHPGCILATLFWFPNCVNC